MLSMMIAIVVSAVAQCFTDPRVAPLPVRKSRIAMGVFALQVGIAIFAMSRLTKPRADDTMWTTLALIGWVGLGALSLVRGAPKLKNPPAFLMTMGWPDVLCFSAIVTGVIGALRDA